jgi:predicted  nucleic acid-binding Zn-ribbon protein
MEKLKENPIEIPAEEKEQIEKDVRKMTGIEQEDTPVILDVESIRAVGDGKFEIDIVNLFNKKRPLIYKLSEGKYVIDLTTTLEKDIKGLKDEKKAEEKQ